MRAAKQHWPALRYRPPTLAPRQPGPPPRRGGLRPSPATGQTLCPQTSACARPPKRSRSLPLVSIYRHCEKKYTTWALRSEEHTSELQSRQYLVCRLLLEKKKQARNAVTFFHVYM